MLHVKLKNARLARGFSLEQLAVAVGSQGVSISKAALSKYERGESSPPSTLLPALARALAVEPGYFFESGGSGKLVWGDFRKSAKLKAKERVQLQAVASQSVEGLVWLEEALLITPAHPITLHQRRKANSLREAEDAAERVRQHLGLELGPVVGLVDLLERNGFIVLGTNHVEDAHFDGLSGWLNDSRPLIVIRSNAPTDRLRFSIAHELGHLVLDCEEVPEPEREELAHRFASAFLISGESAVSELGETRRNLNLMELGLLKRKYGVSIQAWIRRAYDLKIINENLYKKLFIELSTRGWRRSEPSKFDYTGREETSHLRQYTLRALNEGLISAQRARELCPALLELDASTKQPPTSARELLKMSPQERDRILEAAAALAAGDYESDSELTNFRADDFVEY